MRSQLNEWFGGGVSSWETIAPTSSIRPAAAYFPGRGLPAKARLDGDVFVAGDTGRIRRSTGRCNPGGELHAL